MKKIDPYTPRTQVVVDAGIFVLSLMLAYLIRFEGSLAASDRTQLLFWLPCIVGARLLLTWWGGIYSFASEYFSLPDVIATGQVEVLLTTGLLVLRFFYP